MLEFFREEIKSFRYTNNRFELQLEKNFIIELFVGNDFQSMLKDFIKANEFLYLDYQNILDSIEDKIVQIKIPERIPTYVVVLQHINSYINNNNLSRYQPKRFIYDLIMGNCNDIISLILNKKKNPSNLIDNIYNYGLNHINKDEILFGCIDKYLGKNPTLQVEPEHMLLPKIQRICNFYKIKMLATYEDGSPVYNSDGSFISKYNDESSSEVSSNDENLLELLCDNENLLLNESYDNDFLIPI
jgi:hypothetical protein